MKLSLQPVPLQQLAQTLRHLRHVRERRHGIVPSETSPSSSERAEVLAEMRAAVASMEACRATAGSRR